GHGVRVGRVELEEPVTWEAIAALAGRDEVLLNCASPETEEKMKAEVDLALRTGDSIGGVFEVVAHGVPPGLGTYANWDERLDGLLAQAVMSLQAVKAVELGDAITVSAGVGSKAQDEIAFSRESSNEHRATG